MTKTRLVSYNIRKAVGLDRKRNPHRILDVLNALSPDIVALQEADRRIAPRHAAIPHQLIESETDMRLVHLATNDVSLGWHGNAVLVRKGLEVLSTSHIELPSLEPRGAVKVRIATPSGPVSVVGVHLALIRRWRRAQLSAIRSHLEEDVDESASTVVLGDFNEWSPSSGLEALSERFSIVSPGRSYHASMPRGFLDRFAVGTEFRALDTGVDMSKVARRASDHLPIWLDLAPAKE